MTRFNCEILPEEITKVCQHRGFKERETSACMVGAGKIVTDHVLPQLKTGNVMRDNVIEGCIQWLNFYVRDWARPFDPKKR